MSRRDTQRSLVLLSGDSEQSVAPYEQLEVIELTLEGAISGWLDEHSRSPRTRAEYEVTLKSFRQFLQDKGLDLHVGDVRAIKLDAQAWAKLERSRDGQKVSAATHNRRLAIVSSFYIYALQNDLQVAGHPERLVENPIPRVKREKVHVYASATALTQETCREQLAAIDREELAGIRDYALLQVAFHTGRRLAELAALNVGDLELIGAGRVRVHFRHTKGDKPMKDRLSAAVTAALGSWLAIVAEACGVERWEDLPADTPIWIPLQHGYIQEVRPMAHDAVRAVYLKRLGTGKVHTSRHTFVKAMLTDKATVQELQVKLGHANSSTTDRYIGQLTSDENKHSDALDTFFGVESLGARKADTE